MPTPPACARLILCCAAPGRLLPTIRSRCRRLYPDPLDDAAMAELRTTYLPDLADDERGRLITLAEGSPGRALKLAAAEGLKIAALVDEVLAALPNLPTTRACARADTLLRGDTGFATFMDTLRASLAAVREAARGRADPDQARVATQRPTDAWVEVWQALSHLQAETEWFNLDKHQELVAGPGMLSG